MYKDIVTVSCVSGNKIRSSGHESNIAPVRAYYRGTASIIALHTFTRYANPCGYSGQWSFLNDNIYGYCSSSSFIVRYSQAYFPNEWLCISMFGYGQCG